MIPAITKKVQFFFKKKTSQILANKRILYQKTSYYNIYHAWK